MSTLQAYRLIPIVTPMKTSAHCAALLACLTCVVGRKFHSDKGNFSLQTDDDLPVCTGHLLAKAVGNDHWQCDTLSGKRGADAQKKCEGSFDTDASQSTYMQCSVEKRSEAEFNCLAATRCRNKPLPASCEALDTLSFGSQNTEFVKIIDWDKGTAANNGVTFDATKNCVNDLFKTNGGVWLMEVSNDGSTFHEWSVYKQIQKRDDFDAHGYIYNWRSANNKINEQFELYSDVNDAISGNSKWARCNYDDSAAGFARDCCCRSSSQSFEPNKGGGGWGFFAPSRYRGNIRWANIRISMPVKPLEKQKSDLPASCGGLDTLSFGSQNTEFVKIVDWDKGTAANNGVTFDATKNCVNDLFKTNGGVWLMEVSNDGSTFHEWSVYKQIQKRDDFDAHGYIYNWRSANNKINEQFELYSDVNDAISGNSKWARCNYDDSAAGFARDCCCRSSSQSFEPNKGGGGWGFFAPSRYRSNIRWANIRISMPKQALP